MKSFPIAALHKPGRGLIAHLRQQPYTEPWRTGVLQQIRRFAKATETLDETRARVYAMMPDGYAKASLLLLDEMRNDALEDALYWISRLAPEDDR